MTETQVKESPQGLGVKLQLLIRGEQEGAVFISNAYWALVVKNLPACAGNVRDPGSIPGSGRSPGGGRATHSSILAWRIPWTVEPGGLQSVGSQRVGHN